MVESKADHTRKLTKGVRRAMEMESQKGARELAARRAVEEDALDEPEDEWGATRCRVYQPQGHPRTEAGEETIVAADKVYEP